MTKAPNTSKGPRPKHIPQRTCIACRKVDPKRALVRVVRDAEGRVAIDTTGKRAGRGAYLCHTPACWDLAIRRRGLERALRIDALHADDRAMLERFVESLEPALPDSSHSIEI
jgi:predicted RNA-binding protein YlxR (DUF448 family)